MRGICPTGIESEAWPTRLLYDSFYMVLSSISSSTSFETTSVLFACASHADSLTKACVMHIYKIVVENSEMGYEG